MRHGWLGLKPFFIHSYIHVLLHFVMHKQRISTGEIELAAKTTRTRNKGKGKKKAGKRWDS